MTRRYRPGEVVSTLPRFSKREIPELDANHPLALNLQRVVQRPELSLEQKAERKELIDTIKLIDPQGILILRHRIQTEKSGIITSLKQGNDAIQSSTTGTVLSVNPFYVKAVARNLEGYDEALIAENTLKPGDYVKFSVYAPYSFFDDYPEIQIVGYVDIQAKLTKIPKGYVED